MQMMDAFKAIIVIVALVVIVGTGSAMVLG